MSLKGRSYEEIHGVIKAVELRKLRSDYFKKNRKNIKTWNKGKKGVQVAWNKGLTKETDDRVLQYGKSISKIVAGKLRPKSTGNKHWNWSGGLSNDKYPANWRNLAIKRQIFKRDKYKCRICNCKDGIGKRKLVVHHIDYNKYNLKPMNLITLCRSCHAKTNFNRDYWYAYFIYFIEENKNVK